MAEVTLKPGSTITLFDATALNGLANGARLLSTSAVNNLRGGGAAGGYLWGVFTLTVNFGSTPTANTAVSLWLLHSLDNATFEDGSASVLPARPANLWIPVRAASSVTQVLPILAPILPGYFKALLGNDTGVAFPASGASLTFQPYTAEVL